MNEETVKGKWNEIKGEIKTQWAKMTDDELDKTLGNVVSIAGLVQQRYGAKKEEVQTKLDGIMAKFSEKTEEIKNKMKADNSQNKQ
jgi:uncharacterized protein YjbJ (UPF0337 family)